MDLVALLVLALVICGLLVWLVVNYWPWVLALVAAYLVLWLAWTWFQHWYELRRVRQQTAQAKRQLNAAYDQSRARMDRLAREHHLRKGIRK